MGVYARGHEVIGEHAVEWMFTDRTRGHSQGPYAEANLGGHVGDEADAVRANRRSLAAEIGVPINALRTMTQVHGCEIAFIDGPVVAGDEAPPVVDALITKTADLALVTQVADCVPILVATASGHVAAIHAGWRGVVAGVVDAALTWLSEEGDDPATMHAWIGPSICAGCYEVGPEVQAEVCAVTSDAFAHTRWGTTAIDVQAGVRQQLSRWGVVARIVPGCTFEDASLYSYRRDGRTGRQAGIITTRMVESAGVA